MYYTYRTVVLSLEMAVSSLITHRLISLRLIEMARQAHARSRRFRIAAPEIRVYRSARIGDERREQRRTPPSPPLERPRRERRSAHEC